MKNGTPSFLDNLVILLTFYLFLMGIVASGSLAVILAWQDHWLYTVQVIWAVICIAGFIIICPLFKRLQAILKAEREKNG
jgi:membrane protein YdbS with pleckstrin-like domain